MTEEWLDFIVACRQGKSHKYDIVEGPMAVQNSVFEFSLKRRPPWAGGRRVGAPA